MSRLTRGREYVLPDCFTRVTGLSFHCRRGNANFFFFFFVITEWGAFHLNA